MKPFPLGDVLSITTGCLVADRGMDAVYEILNYLTGEALFTHQLVRAAGLCGPALLAQHPQLAAVVVPEWPEDREACRAAIAHWLAAEIARHGATLACAPLPPGVYTPMHPVEELVAMRKPDVNPDNDPARGAPCTKCGTPLDPREYRKGDGLCFGCR